MSNQRKSKSDRPHITGSVGGDEEGTPFQLGEEHLPQYHSKGIYLIWLRLEGLCLSPFRPISWL